MSIPKLVEPPAPPVESFDEVARRARYVVRPPAAIFDMDGTLVDVAGIRHYVLANPKRKDFNAFHAASVFCPPHAPVLELARVLHEAGIAILVLTSRSWKWHSQSKGWLLANGVEHEMLAMRAEGDHRKDVDVKRDLLAVVRERFTVVMAVDDNPAIIELWNDEGIPTVVWPSWDFSFSPVALTSADQAQGTERSGE